MKKSFPIFLFAMVFLVSIASAIPFTPSGNINLRDTYNITGAPYINATLYYGNLSQMTGNVPTANSSEYWDNYDTANDLNNLITIQGENISGGTIAFARLPTLTNMITLDWANITNRFITAVDNIYIYMSGSTATLNETKLNLSIRAIDTATNTSMKNYVDGKFITQANEENLNVNYSTISNSTTWWATISGYASKWFYNSGNDLTFNETQLNNSIEAYGYSTTTGTVTSVATDDSYLTGGAITTTGTITFNTTLAGTSLATNTSNYWDNLGVPTDLNNLITLNWANITNKFITAVSGNYLYMTSTTMTLNETYLNTTISALDTDTTYTAGSNITLTGTQFNWSSTWVDTLFPQITELVGLIGNWSADKADYSTTAEAGVLYYNKTSNIDAIGYNVTADNFKGKFNWTTTDEWSNFDGNIFDFNESNLETTYFLANAIQVVTGSGSGNLTDIQTYNQTTYNVTESNSDFELRVNFTGITDFTTLLVRHKTSVVAGHIAAIQIWDYSTSTWEGYGYLSELTTSAMQTLGVYDADDHIDGGVVQVRFYQTDIGNAGHVHQFDWVGISKGYGTPVGEEVDPFSIHKDGSVPLIANWDQGVYNFTNTDSWFKGKINYSDVQNHPADSDTTYINGSGISLVGTQFNHSDTSSQASSDNSGRTYIQDIILDTYGHITSIVTATETVTDTDTQDLSYNATTDVISLVDGGSIDITEVDTSANTICSGGTTYLDGDGNCDDISGVYIDEVDEGNLNVNHSTTSGTATTWDGETSQADLNVNSSAYWDGLNSPSDINAGDITDDGTFRLNSWDNFTGIPIATPSDGDTTHLSTADQIRDYIIGLAYATTSYVDGLISSVGNWSNDKSDYWNSSLDLDTVIATDEITELKIDFNTNCAAGNHLYVSGNNLACEADDDTTYTNGSALSLVGTTFNLTACSDNEIWKMSGTSWNCEADATGSTSDTNASTECSGTTTYLDGEGNCDDISSVYRADSWDNFTGIPHATPSNGDVTHFSWADEIYDWVISLGYATTTYVDDLVATYTHLSNYTDDLGDRGYTSNSNFSNDEGYTTNTGTVTSIATTAPISGGTITTTGTLSLAACSDTEIYKYNSTSGVWECEADTGGTVDYTNVAMTNISETFDENLDVTGNLTIGNGTTYMDLYYDGSTNRFDTGGYNALFIDNITADYFKGAGDELTGVRLNSWDNFTGIPTATPSDGDTTHLSTADQIRDYVVALAYATVTYVDSLGNWSADKSVYWNASTDLDSVIATDEITELKIDFNTVCASGNHLYVDGNNLACEADANTNDGNASSICSGTTTYLDGEGNCDNISSVYEDAGAHFDISTTANITCLDTACNFYTNATDSCLYWPSGGKDCGA